MTDEELECASEFIPAALIDSMWDACAIASHQWLPRYRLHWLLLPLAVLLLNLPETWLQLQPAPYKRLSKALLLPQSRVVETRSSPLGQLDVVESPTIPFCHAPGISINSRRLIPDQLAIFDDADDFSAIARYDGDLQSLAYLDDLTSALPYHLLDRPRVLIVGLGGGADVLQASYGAATAIDVLEQNPQRAALLFDRFGDYAGLHQLPVKPRIHHADARGFLSVRGEPYDLIQLATGYGGGLSSLLETYLYTTEAFAQYWQRLSDRGLIAVSGEITIPPKTSLRMLTTAIASLRREGKNPQPHLALIRGWKTWTLLVARQPLKPSAVQSIRLFCLGRAFDTVYYPGIEISESNRFNLLPQDHFYRAAMALLGSESEDFKQAYKFNIEPVTDDRPYFFQFFKWSTFAEWWSLRQRGGMALLDAGYPVLLATLLQALVFSVVLILLPLMAGRKKQKVFPPGENLLAIFSYFLLVGLAFIMIEIAFIQQLLLFLSHPVFSIAAAIAAFLFFAGLGSLWAKHRHRNSRDGALPCIAVAAIALCYLFLLPELFSALLSLPIAVKATIALICIAPLAFFMGMPFPLGLDRVEKANRTWLPWCWGINGCASVISAVMSMLLASHFGFSATVLLAVALYLLAFVAVRKFPDRDEHSTAALQKN